MSHSNPPIRCVVIHTAGSRWQRGTDFREQPGVMEHVQHYARLHEQRKLEMRGSFLLPDAGGMMVPTQDVSREEIEASAAADPAVKSGLLKFEIEPWYTPMERSK